MPHLSRRTLACLAVALLLVLAGCSGGEDSGAAGDYRTGGDSADYEQIERDGDDGSSEEHAVQFDHRQLVRTGAVRLRVASFDRTSANLTAAARDRGGFVSDSHQRVDRDGDRAWTSGKLVFRIPRENFSAFVERAKAEGEVQSATTDSEDVTDQLVDIEARLDNSRAERDRLRTLYQEANETEDVLAVEERLSDVQEEIERLEARRESLREQVAYSTVTVRLAESRPAISESRAAWYDTGVVTAFAESVTGVVVVLRALVVGTAYAAPYVLAFGLPLGAIYALRRR